MFAIIETGGKQYKTEVGKVLRIEKLPGEADESFKFDKVLLVAEAHQARLGQPYLGDAVVEAKILGHGRADKKIVFRYHSKTRYRKKKGHRQNYTEVEVTKIR